MPTWDPAQYLKFADHRLRPALDLIARIPRETCRAVWDLGCGPGTVTQLLRNRYPDAHIAGLDNAPEMIRQARAIPGIDWTEGEIDGWTAPAPADLIFSNAVLHWVGDHRRLFPHLMRQLERGGVLAVQMPRNFEAPSHTLLYATAREEPWAARLAPHLHAAAVAAPDAYYDILMPHATHIDLWETEYLHVLQGENAVLEWTKGSAVRPFLDVLPTDQQPAFIARYAARLRTAYPRRADGMTLFPFRRLFVVAVR